MFKVILKQTSKATALGILEPWRIPVAMRQLDPACACLFCLSQVLGLYQGQPGLPHQPPPGYSAWLLVIQQHGAFPLLGAVVSGDPSLTWLPLWNIASFFPWETNVHPALGPSFKAFFSDCSGVLVELHYDLLLNPATAPQAWS